jgi:hypothetical protein
VAELAHTLVRLLAQTQTENDTEALLFIRKANELIKKDSKTWYDFVTSQPVVPPTRKPPPGPKPHTSSPPGGEYDDSGLDWKEIIEGLLAQTWIRADGRKFLMSVQAMFEKYHRLTVRQAAAVQKFYPK